MKTYLLKSPDNYPNTRIGVYNNDLSPNYISFIRGKKIEEPLQTIIIDFDCPKRLIEKYGVVHCTSNIPLLREDTLELIWDLIEGQVQLLDVLLRTKDTEMRNYKMLNILNCVEGVNIDESICTYFDDGSIFDFKYLVLKENCLKGLNIARLKESLTDRIASEALKERFEKHKVKGIRFVEPEVYYSELYNLEKVFADAGRVWKGLKKA